MQGNSPLTSLTRFFQISFHLHPHSIFFRATLIIFIYSFFQAGQQGERRSTHQSTPIPNQTTHPPQHLAPPFHITLIPQQGEIHVMQRHSASPHAAGGLFTLCFAKYFLCELTLFFLCYFRDPPRSCHPLKAVMRKMEYI